MIHPDPGLLSDIYHFSKRGHIESNKKGSPEPTYKLVMGAALVWMGAVMAMDAWKKMHPPVGRVR
jgi:hypothetical protein